MMSVCLEKNVYILRTYDSDFRHRNGPELLFYRRRTSSYVFAIENITTNFSTLVQFSSHHACFDKTLCMKESSGTLREDIIPLRCCHALE